ncbi:GyrI-like domain-containing protein [Allofournierella sp.]|uniref:GyrI-like domain-containing protein n=1 Tax=Allofournierella sp. TaxID=1940256 RepID=UPI003AB666D9
MNNPFRIEKRESFRVVGSLLQTTNQRGEGRRAIPAHWAGFRAEHREQALLALAKQEPQGLFGINLYNTDPADPRKFEYLIAVSSDRDAPEGFVEYTVPAMTWAVFPCTLETLGKTEAMAISKWLPKSDYRPLNKGYLTGRMKAGAPDVEHYGKDGLVEVWIAVREK